MKNLIIAASFSILGSLTVLANNCKVPGCLRYAPKGKDYCTIHWEEAKAAKKKAALEAMEIRKVVRENEAIRRANEKAAREIYEAEEAKARKIAADLAKAKKIEQKKFEQPLEGLFGRRLGEQLPGNYKSLPFTPEIKFREFTGYTLYADGGSQSAVMISAYRDMGNDEKLARAELEAVLLTLKEKYDRKPNKIFTRSGNEVYALGFGGKNGVAGQVLQLTLKHVQDKGYRLELSASKNTSTEKKLVEQTIQDIKAL